MHARTRGGLCSPPAVANAAIIHLATNHPAESDALLNCTQVENQICNEREMLRLSIICGDTSSEEEPRNEGKMQMSAVTPVYVQVVYLWK